MRNKVNFVVILCYHHVHLMFSLEAINRMSSLDFSDLLKKSMR